MKRLVLVAPAMVGTLVVLGLGLFPARAPSAAANPGGTALAGRSAAARTIAQEIENRFSPASQRSVDFALEARGLRPRFAGARAVVHLPLRADGYFELSDAASGVSLAARLLGASAAPAEPVRAAVVYRQSLGAAHVVHRPTPAGTEDFVLFPEPPAQPELRYELALGEGVTGLRSVAGALEFLDGGGAPRLRVTRPYLVAADGTRRDASLAVEGCAVESSPAPPWGRRVLSPGARSCELTVRWSGEALRYPIVVDPGWESGGSMSVSRLGHSVTRLGDGRILAAGSPSDSTGTSAEVYDPASNTWANVGSMASRRGADPVLVTLESGGALVAGGGYYDLNVGAMVGLSTAELFDPATGTWSATGDMADGRVYAAGVRLGDGSVLVAGGRQGSNALPTAEVYQPTTGTWSGVGTLSARAGHSMLRLADGRVMVVGGTTRGVSEIYDPATGVFGQAAYLNEARTFAAAALLADGRILVAGGAFLTTALSSTELWDPVGNSWSAGPELSGPRVDAFVASLPSGFVMVGGGTDVYPGTDGMDSVETFDPSANAWSAAPAMTIARSGPKAAVLESGDVLVTGDERDAEIFRGGAAGDSCLGCNECASGFCSGGSCLDSPAANGADCACDGACASGFCVDGTCCDTACDSPCEACAAAEKRSGSDGECGAVAPGSDPRGSCAAGCANGGQCGEQGCICLPASGSVCDGDALLGSDGSRLECAPYACQADMCLTTCSGASGCASGFECSAGRCAAPGGASGGTSDDSGCGCSLPGRSPAKPWEVWLLALGLAALRRRP